MTLPKPEAGVTRVSPQAIATNGEGNVSSYHINLTRSLADDWKPDRRPPLRTPDGKIPYPGYSGKLA
jgi:hypothetical protein